MRDPRRGGDNEPVREAAHRHRRPPRHPRQEVVLRLPLPQVRAARGHIFFTDLRDQDIDIREQDQLISLDLFKQRSMILNNPAAGAQTPRRTAASSAASSAQSATAAAAQRCPRTH